MTSRVADAHDRLQQAVAELRAIAASATGTELCEVLSTVEAGQRSLDQVSVTALSAAQRDGVFAERGYRSTAGALADLLRWDPRRSRRYVVAAEQIVDRVGLDGQALPPRLETTADGVAGGRISMRHVEVIAGLLGTKAAERIGPESWALAEEQLSAWAPDYTPAELHTWGTQLIEALDQDGPEPDDDPQPQVNEVHIARYRNRPGGTVRGRFDDAEMFDRIAAAVDTHGRPRDGDDTRTPAERQAEGLADICGHALAHAPSGVLPGTGGRRPQLVVTVRLEDLEQRARGGMLEFGGRTSPAALRMLACDAAVVPVVLGGRGEPVDVGRAMRTVPDGMRRAVIARDQGCAHPGCGLPPAWCQVHHVVPWEHHGPTRVDNLVLLCAVHHRLVHHSGWEVRIAGGRPEFVPPGWIDPWRRPRRRPDPTQSIDLTDVTGLADPAAPRAPVDLSGTAVASGQNGSPTDGNGESRSASMPQVAAAGTVPAPRPSSDPPPNRAPRVADLDGCAESEQLGAPAIRVVDFADLDDLSSSDR